MSNFNEWMKNYQGLILFFRTNGWPRFSRAMVSGSWLNWWQRWVARVWPHYDRGRPKAVSMAL